MATKAPTDAERAWSLKKANPALYELCHQWYRKHLAQLDWLLFVPAEERYHRAVWLLHTGAVERNGSPLDYYVKSGSAPNIKYRVSLTTSPYNTTGNWLCTMAEHPNRGRIHDWCPDTDPNRGGRAPDLGHGPRCKHMIAAAIAHEFPEVLTLAHKEAPAAATAEASEIPPGPTDEDLTADSTTDWAKLKAWASGKEDRP